MRVRTHPGEILRREFLEPLGLSARALAEAIEVPANRISEIVRENRGMTADTALRLAKYFDTTPEFWMNLQTAHDLSIAAQSTVLALAAHDKGARSHVHDHYLVLRGNERVIGRGHGTKAEAIKAAKKIAASALIERHSDTGEFTTVPGSVKSRTTGRTIKHK